MIKFLLIIFVTLVSADELTLNDTVQYKHTKVFNKYWDGTNQNYSFFDSRTFGIDIYPDPCEKISSSKFRNFINYKLQCLGKWCVHDQFGNCRKGNVDCYHVERIIDKRSPQFENELESDFDSHDKLIAANFVMTWGRWNAELDRLDYESSSVEKRIVYSDNLINRVRAKISDCRSRPPKPSVYNYEKLFIESFEAKDLMKVIGGVKLFAFINDTNFTKQLTLRSGQPTPISVGSPSNVYVGLSSNYMFDFSGDEIKINTITIDPYNSVDWGTNIGSFIVKADICTDTDDTRIIFGFDSQYGRYPSHPMTNGMTIIIHRGCTPIDIKGTFTIPTAYSYCSDCPRSGGPLYVISDVSRVTIDIHFWSLSGRAKICQRNMC
ncbi:MAG: hypothetical protein Hyperionvirus3_74 [Hyperionvirus sp.]|uniref:Uncharacterized protein n=1 Tax=Hyperionvirus sp. TaxID=2487770 RepID=A0A3G5A6X7_9VIRU|nr:MAG: hypothetical protein Hyperionvirus3_74 [Hyperionvirus sp.]